MKDVNTFVRTSRTQRDAPNTPSSNVAKSRPLHQFTSGDRRSPQSTRCRLNCALEFEEPLTLIYFGMSGRDDGLEPATSAVTALHEMLLQQLTKHAGTAKRSASHTRQIELWVGLWVENDQPLNHRLGFVVCAMPESRPLDD